MEGTEAADAEEANREAENRPGTDVPPVSALRSSPDRVVFSEDGNSDGWISIDTELTSSVER